MDSRGNIMKQQIQPQFDDLFIGVGCLSGAYDIELDEKQSRTDHASFPIP